MHGFELRVWGLGFRVQGSGFRVQGSGFRVQGSGFESPRATPSGFEGVAHVLHRAEEPDLDVERLVRIQYGIWCLGCRVYGCHISPSILVYEDNSDATVQ